MRLLLIGFSKFSQKRLIPSIKKNKTFNYEICSKHSNNKEIKYKNYLDAIKSKPDLVYISLTNNLHYYYAKLCLKKKIHVIVDKPLALTLKQSNELIKIAKSNQVLLAEATLFDYHYVFRKINKLMGGKKNIKQISSYFHIPKIKTLKKIIYTSSDCFFDMSPYAAAIIRIYMNKKILKIKGNLKKISQNAVESFQVLANSNNLNYFGSFSNNQEYISQVSFYSKKKIISITNQAFALPNSKKVEIIIKNDNLIKKLLIKKDDCINNFLQEVKKSIIKKDYKNFYQKIIFDSNIKQMIKSGF